MNFQRQIYSKFIIQTIATYGASGKLAFLMDCETGEDGMKILTAKKTATSRLVAILVMVAVMGISQSGLFLSLAKAGLELKDDTLELLIRELSYAV